MVNVEEKEALMIYKAVLFTLVVALIVPLAAPGNRIAAQEGEPTDEFILSAADLALGVYVAPADYDGDAVTDLTLTLAESGEGTPLAIISAQIVPRNGKTYHLTAAFVPITLERGLRWDVATWTLTEAEGSVVEDPPGIIAIFISQLKRGFARAVFDGLKDAVQERYPDGLPGRPQGILPYMEQGNLAFEITWETPGEGESFAESLPADLIQSELPVIEETEETITYYLEQGAINTALSQLADPDGPVETLSYELTYVLVTSLVTMRGPDDEEMTLALSFPFAGSSAGEPVPSEEITMNVLGTAEASGAMYVLESATDQATGEPAPDPLANRAAQMASRAMNRYLAAQLGFADVSGLTVVDGGIEVTVAKEEQ
jgi:hypothetical protein